MGKYNTKVNRLYRIWNNMKCRCKNKNNDSYKYYGAKGIKVCDEWSESFVAFEKWALENGYNDSLTIDRINNDGDYEPLNCRWATYEEQNLHLRQRESVLGVRNVKIVGKRYCVSVRRNNKEHYIGLYADLKDAIEARDKFCEEWANANR